MYSFIKVEHGSSFSSLISRLHWEKSFFVHAPRFHLKGRGGEWEKVSEVSSFYCWVNMTMEEGRVENEDYTQDGTVNIKGKPILRSKSGGWKACSFVVGKLSLFSHMSSFSLLTIKLFSQTCSNAVNKPLLLVRS